MRVSAVNGTEVALPIWRRAHLAEQAKILIEDAEERDLGAKAFSERWARWLKCSLCEQQYYGRAARAQLGVLEDVMWEVDLPAMALLGNFRRSI